MSCAIDIIRTATVKGSNDTQYPADSVIPKHMNTIATKLLQGRFSSQDEAIDLLLDYKILTCLSFAITNMNGTQIMNIVKINYLVDCVRKNNPDIIDPRLRIPHIHQSTEIAHPYNQSPELAVIIRSPARFKAEQKAQIQSILHPQPAQGERRKIFASSNQG